MQPNNNYLPLHVRILAAELDRRKSSNNRYSLRAFAKALNWHPSATSRILAGKQEISIASCSDVLNVLRLTLEDARLFISSVAQDKCNRASALLSHALLNAYSDDLDERYSQILIDPGNQRLAANTALSVHRDFASITDIDGKFLHVSESLASMTGKIPCDLIGMTWQKTGLPPDMCDLLEQQEREAFERSTEIVYRFSVPEDGSVKQYERILTPIFGKKNGILGFLSRWTDLTSEYSLIRMIENIHSPVEPDSIFKTVTAAVVPHLAGASILQVFNVDGKLIPVSASYKTDEDGLRILSTFKSLNEELQLLAQISNDLIDTENHYAICQQTVTVGEFRASQIINIRLGQSENPIGILTLLSSEKRNLSDKERFAISTVRIAATQALSRIRISV